MQQEIFFSLSVFWCHITLILIMVNDLLILVIRVTTISFMVATLVTYEKSIDKMLHIERFFLLLRF